MAAAERGDRLDLGAVNTAPVGLCGLLIQMTRVRGVIACANAREIGMKSALRPERDVDQRRPARAADGLVGGVHRLRHDDLVARPGQAADAQKSPPWVPGTIATFSLAQGRPVRSANRAAIAARSAG